MGNLPGALLAAQALFAVGCPRDVASRMVATADRESGYSTFAHTFGCGCGPGQCRQPSPCNPGAVCEDSWGLWQINRCAHPQFNSIVLATSIGNARAAKSISGNFSDLSPWRGGADPTAESDKAVSLIFRGKHPGKVCDPRCQAPDGATQAEIEAAIKFNLNHGDLCKDCSVLTGPPVTQNLGDLPVVRNFVDIVEAISFLVNFITDPHHWLLLGMAILGVLLVGAGLVFAVKDWSRGA